MLEGAVEAVLQDSLFWQNEVYEKVRTATNPQGKGAHAYEPYYKGDTYHKGAGKGYKGKYGKDDLCLNCGRAGHRKKDCWAPGGGAHNPKDKGKGAKAKKDKGKTGK